MHIRRRGPRQRAKYRASALLHSRPPNPMPTRKDRTKNPGVCCVKSGVTRTGRQDHQDHQNSHIGILNIIPAWPQGQSPPPNSFWLCAVRYPTCQNLTKVPLWSEKGRTRRVAADKTKKKKRSDRFVIVLGSPNGWNRQGLGRPRLPACEKRQQCARAVRLLWCGSLGE